MAVSFFVMGQKLTQFGSSDVEVEVGVKVLNALADTASHYSHVSCGSTNQLFFVFLLFDNFNLKMLSSLEKKSLSEMLCMS